MYDGTSGWLGFHIAVAAVAYFINIYATSIAANFHLYFIVLAYVIIYCLFCLFVGGVVIVIAIQEKNEYLLFILLIIPLFIFISLVIFCYLHNSKYSRNPKHPCYGI